MGYESIIYVNLNPSTFKPKDFLRFFDQSDELFGLSRYYKSKVITANEIILDSTLNLNAFSEMLKKSNITPIDFYSKINQYIYLEDRTKIECKKCERQYHASCSNKKCFCELSTKKKVRISKENIS